MYIPARNTSILEDDKSFFTGKYIPIHIYIPCLLGSKGKYYFMSNAGSGSEGREFDSRVGDKIWIGQCNVMVRSNRTQGSDPTKLGRSVIEIFFTSCAKRASLGRALQVPEHPRDFLRTGLVSRRIGSSVFTPDHRNLRTRGRMLKKGEFFSAGLQPMLCCKQWFLLSRVKCSFEVNYLV
jgi:hypothetical protein